MSRSRVGDEMTNEANFGLKLPFASSLGRAMQLLFQEKLADAHWHYNNRDCNNRAPSSSSSSSSARVCRLLLRYNASRAALLA